MFCTGGSKNNLLPSRSSPQEYSSPIYIYRGTFGCGAVLWWGAWGAIWTTHFKKRKSNGWGDGTGAWIMQARLEGHFCTFPSSYYTLRHFDHSRTVFSSSSSSPLKIKGGSSYSIAKSNSNHQKTSKSNSNPSVIKVNRGTRFSIFTKT